MYGDMLSSTERSKRDTRLDGKLTATQHTVTLRDGQFFD